MPYLLFLKKRQNLQLSSAANYMWRFKGLVSGLEETMEVVEFATLIILSCVRFREKMLKSFLYMYYCIREIGHDNFCQIILNSNQWFKKRFFFKKKKT